MQFPRVSRGQMQVTVAVIGVIGVVAVPFISGRAGAETKLAEISGDVRVVAERENNHYAEIQKQLDEQKKQMELQTAKIDQIIRLISN